MWSREFLKDRAKSVLKVSYWKAFLVSLIIAIACGDDHGLFKYNHNYGNNNSIHGTNSFLVQSTKIFPFLALFSIVIVIAIILFVLAFHIFLGYPLEVGGRRYFVQAAQNHIDLNYLGYGFSHEKYLDIVKTMLWRGLLNFLWFLLLIIPGIIKAYAYMMVPYILGDNPNIGYKRAIELSIKMTDGEKMDMWVLQLSFIGWYLLGILLFQVGVLFVMPYENATLAELYLVLRQNAIETGLCSYEELKLTPPLKTL
jgi:uncharacterized membrane protein